MLLMKPPVWKKPGINRNIVECKCPIEGGIAPACRELIETLWNVNSDQ